MTTEQKTFIKQNWLTATNLVFLVAIIINQAKWQQHVDNKLLEFDKHMNNEIQHMPFQEKIEVFVPRVELDGRLRNIENALLDIKESLKDGK